jgi:hypothetical protein
LILDAGALKPLEDPSDDPVNQRLYNLGYGTSDFNDVRSTLYALEAFQKDNQLQETVNINDETRQKIREVYGS